MDETELNKWLELWFKQNKSKFQKRNWASRNIIARTLKKELKELGFWKCRPRGILVVDNLKSNAADNIKNKNNSNKPPEKEWKTKDNW